MPRPLLPARLRPALGWAIPVVAFAVTTVLCRFRFYPDARFYYAYALHVGGTSRADAAAEVARVASPSWDVLTPSELFDNGMVQARIVYPALSAPFVKLFGLAGMHVIPVAAAIAVFVICAVQLNRRYGRWPAITAMTLFGASQSIVRPFMATLTESLTALWTLLTVLAAVRWVQRRSRWALVAAGALTLVSAFTRQATLIAAGALAVAWLGACVIAPRAPDGGHSGAARWRLKNGWGLPAIIVGTAAVGLQLLQSVVWPSFPQPDQYAARTGTTGTLAGVLAIPREAVRIAATEGWYIVSHDPVLLVLILASLVAIVALWRRPESWLTLGAWAGIGVYYLVNGSATTHFRYGLPAVPILLMAAAALTRWVIDRREGRAGGARPQAEQAAPREGLRG